jgi:hypothetical protein
LAADNESNSGAADFTGTDSYTFNASLGYLNDSFFASSVTPFQGTGLVNIGVVRTTSYLPNAASDLSRTVISAGTTTGSAILTYTYTPAAVPEAGAFVLTGAAALAGGVVALRRKRNLT